MADVFISYARKDRARARAIYKALAAQGLDVFWDPNLQLGDDFPKRLETELRTARSVLVLWSEHSVASRWVRAEASIGAEGGVMFEVLLDSAHVPLPFGRLNHMIDLSRSRRLTRRVLGPLASQVAQAIVPDRSQGELDAPVKGQPVTKEHLAIIHTSSRGAESHRKEYGVDQLYNFEVMLVAHKSVLDRVQKVKWYLHPSFEDWGIDKEQKADRRSRRTNFYFKSEASGDFVINASVQIRDQVELVRLSRFLNMMASGDSLDDFLS